MLTMIKIGDRIIDPTKVRSVEYCNEPDPEVSQETPYVAVFYTSDDVLYFYGAEAVLVWSYFQGAATELKVVQPAKVELEHPAFVQALRSLCKQLGASKEQIEEIEKLTCTYGLSSWEVDAVISGFKKEIEMEDEY